jgi:hypothetical protein
MSNRRIRAARAAEFELNMKKKTEPENQLGNSNTTAMRDMKQTTHPDPKCGQNNLSASKNWRRKIQPKN